MVLNQNERVSGALLQNLDKTRQMDLIRAIGADAATERHILNRVGDTRYTRELLRKLISMNIVERTGKGGLHDPYRYKLSPFLSAFDFSCVPDPVLERRMKRIEDKIVDLLSDNDRTTARSERCIRAVVGDNTGTGKALRRLVKSSKVASCLSSPLLPRALRIQWLSLTSPCCQVERIGRGGAGSPFLYRLGGGGLIQPSANAGGDDECAPPHPPPSPGPAALFEEMAALMAPRPAPCGAPFGEGGDSEDEDGPGAGGEGGGEGEGGGGGPGDRTPSRAVPVDPSEPGPRCGPRSAAPPPSSQG